MLLAVPALRALRAGHSTARLTLAAQVRIATLLARLGAVDEGLDFDALGLNEFFAGDIRRAEPRRFFFGPPTARAGLGDPATINHLISWFGAGDPAFVEGLRALVPGAVVAPSRPAAGLVWEHLLATAGGVTDSADRAPLAVPDALIAEGDRVLRASGWDGATPLVMVHPGAGGIAKRWPAEGFARALGELGAGRPLAVAVHQGPADADAVGELLGRARGPLVRLVEPALPLLAGATSRAAVWLGNDSGPSHLAAAIGVPALVLFTASNLPWRSWADAARPLVVETEALRPPDLEAVGAQLGTMLA